MSKILDQALEELKALPEDAQDAIAADLLEMIRSERKWDELFADPRSEAVLKRLAAEAEADIARGDVVAIVTRRHGQGAVGWVSASSARNPTSTGSVGLRSRSAT